MAQQIKNIFLSASIPVAERDRKYIETADVIAIRDSVIALASVVLPHYRLIWGGHPSITRLIAQVLRHSSQDVNQHVTLYQSKYFERYFPLENEDVAHIVYTPDLGDKTTSLFEMRKKMICCNGFAAGIFIGGMEGVEDEFRMFSKVHPHALLLPIASTGAAAKIIYDKAPEEYDSNLMTELTYASLFKKIFQI